MYPTHRAVMVKVYFKRKVCLFIGLEKKIFLLYMRFMPILQTQLKSW